MTTTATVPGLRQVGINGIGFLVDDAKGRGIKRRSIPFLRNQADTGNKPGAQSLSPAGQWRSYQEDWSHGAGQSHRDREDSDPARFRSSKGIYVWDKWRMSLLASASSVRAIAGTTGAEGKVVTATDRLYVTDGNKIYYSTNLTTWTDTNIGAGEAGVVIADITSDQFTITAALGVNGIHTYTTNNPSSHQNDLNADVIRAVKGRQMAGKAGKLYNITAAGAAPAALYTHAHDVSGWQWTSFAEGPGHIYAAGHNAYGLSEIFKITIQPDGTALTAPTLAAPAMPVGERVLSMLGYAGVLAIGTSRGVRIATIGSDGNLSLGSGIPVANVTALVGKDRFVYFAWNNYETNLHGLGRMDLTEFTAALTPAYASDLIGGDGSQIQSIAVFGDRVVFGVRGRAGAPGGVYVESLTDKVASGTLDTGDISYGITDDKVATQLDVSHQVLLGSHQASLAVNGGVFSSLGTHTEGGADGPFSIPETKGEHFEIRHTLSRDTAGTGGPTITRSTLSTYPVPRRPSEVFEVWLVLHTAEALNNGSVESRDPLALLDDIIALERNGTVIDFQLGAQSYRALIEDHQFESESEPSGAWPQGSVGLTVRAI